MINKLKYHFKRVLCLGLSLLVLFAALPMSASAASSSNWKIDDNVYLDALTYLGFDLDGYKKAYPDTWLNAWDTKTLPYQGKAPYGLGATGLETKNGKPNLAAFQEGGLVCGSFVAYVLLNYMPNVAGINTSSIAAAMKGRNTKTAAEWDQGLATMVASGGKVEVFNINGDESKYSLLQGGDILIYADNQGRISHVDLHIGAAQVVSYGVKQTFHVVVFAGGTNPGLEAAERMADGENTNSPGKLLRAYRISDIVNPFGGIELYKTDPNGNPLAGAEFKVYDTANAVKATLVTDSKGYAATEIRDLEVGTYTVKETKAPTNYQLSSTTYTVKVEGNKMSRVGGANFTIQNVPKKGKVKIVKTSEDGLIAGLSFRITGNGVDEYVTTDENGEIVIPNLEPGTYTVTELVPFQYEPQASKNVTVQPDKTATVSFHNTLKRGTVEVVKTSEDGLVAGVTFRLTGTSFSGAAVNMTATTNASGVATFTGVLLNGSAGYTLTEENTKQQYIIPPAQNVRVSWGEVISATVHNELKKGYVELYKTETVNQKGLADTVYGIYDSTDKKVGTLTTDQNGYAKSELLTYGNYYLKEETAPIGWLVSNEKHPFSITENGATVTVRATDEPQLGRIEVEKQGEVLTGAEEAETDFGTSFTPIYEEAPLSGAVIELTAAEDIVVNGVVQFAKDAVVATATTDQSGAVTFADLYPGAYAYREVTAPIGFALGENNGVLTLTADTTGAGLQATATITNERQKATVTVKKAIEDNEIYPSADAYQEIVFGLFAAEPICGSDGQPIIEADALMGICGIDADGNGVFEVDLPVGFVGTVKELQTAEGYLLDKTAYPVAFDRPGQTVSLVAITANNGEAIDNKVIKGHLEIIKKSRLPEEITNQGHQPTPLEGAVYGIYRADGEPVRKLPATDSEGKAQLRDLPYGEYYLQELIPPERYLLDPTKYPFSITEDGVTVTMELWDDPIPQPDPPQIQAPTPSEPVVPQTGDKLAFPIGILILASSLAILTTKTIRKGSKKS